MTLYLKYRPQTISDLDLVDVRQMLGKLLQAKDLPHAFLFSGPRGTGKTSAARIFAKAVNCTQRGKDGEPCNICDACISITSGSAMDLVEVDAASNRGIDEIRELRDGIQLSPMSLKYKVYIIDEVHMLTTEAANALLKTLEEPPSHALFLLCTTDPQKLPETVVSRCTQVHFKSPSQEEAIARLEKIIKGEKWKAEKAALELIATAGRGSFRDEVKILEQVWLSQGDITEDATRSALNLLVAADPALFLEHWKSGNVDACLSFIDALAQSGVNLRSFIERALELLRQELLTTKSRSVLQYIEQLDLAYDRTKSAAVAQLPLEVMIIQSIGLEAAAPTQKVEPNTTTHPVAPEITKTAPETPKSEAAPVKKVEAPVVEDKSSSAKGKFVLADMVAKWPDILKTVRPKNHSIEALLRSTSPVEFDGQNLELEVFYKFHKDKLESEKCRLLIEETISEVFNVPHIRLKLKLGNKQKSQELSAVVEDDIVKAAAEIFKVDAV